MLLTCRSTVRSLIVSAVGDRTVRQARGHESEHLRLAGAQARRGSALRWRPRRSRSRSDGRAESLEHPARGLGLQRRRSHGRRARGRHRLSATRTRAASYGASRSRQASHARRREASAPWTSPSASRTKPSARVAIARSSGASNDSDERRQAIRGGARHRATSTGGERDLDGRLEQPRRGPVVGRLGERAPDRCGAASS